MARPAQQSPLRSALAEARALARDGFFGAAIERCREGLAVDWMCAAAHHLHGLLLERAGATTAAVRALQLALELDPGFAVAHLALGRLQLGRGNADASARHLAAAIRLLERCAPGDRPPGADGATAGELAAEARALLAGADALHP